MAYALSAPVGDTVGKVAGFSLYAGVAARADERRKLERLCRYITRPTVSERRLSLTPNGNIRYQAGRVVCSTLERAMLELCNEVSEARGVYEADASQIVLGGGIYYGASGTLCAFVGVPLTSKSADNLQTAARNKPSVSHLAISGSAKNENTESWGTWE